MVENLARKLPQTTRYAKQHLNFWRDLAWHETINHARDWLALSMATDEPKAAIEKFLEREVSLVLVERDGAVAVVLLNRPEALNALSDELMDELVTDARRARPRRRGPLHRPRRQRARLRRRRRHRRARRGLRDRSLLRAPRRALGRDSRALDAARRRGLGLLPRRRLRASDELRPDRRLRDGRVRPARDRPWDHPGRRWHAAADPRGRQGAGDGRDPQRPRLSAREALQAGLVARVVAKEAWLEDAQRLAREWPPSHLTPAQVRRLSAYSASGQKLVGERLAATIEVLTHADNDRYSLELYTTDNSDPARVERFLTRARDLVPLEQMFIIPLGKEGAWRMRVALGQYQSREEALDTAPVAADPARVPAAPTHFCRVAARPLKLPKSLARQALTAGSSPFPVLCSARGGSAHDEA